MKFKKEDKVRCFLKEDAFFMAANWEEAGHIAESARCLVYLLDKLKLKQVDSLEALTKEKFYLFIHQMERTYGADGTVIAYDKDEDKYLVKFKKSSLWVAEEFLKGSKC